ncbi:unnamed protein product [Caenorhabditis angaria]|uniref:Uncharacterized protein n=1 Tax=Caenorhabditis angaria TaxID=860376 RepID=A0A9P1ICI4_9PELO|nr:unnamed protein product [Caenorhabditis angaria]
MASTYDYALLDFTATLSRVEMNFSENLQSIIDTFANSRLDLPLKRISEIAKVHSRAARNLRKLDSKKNEHINLWKVCNIYSALSVDLDKAMRETRQHLRARMSLDGAPIEKPKKRTIFENFLGGKIIDSSFGTTGSTNTNTSSNISSNQNEEKHSKVWLRRFTRGDEKRTAFSARRKETTASIDSEKFDEIDEITTPKSTPQTPASIRDKANPSLKSSLSLSSDVCPPSRRPPPPPNQKSFIEEHSLRHLDDSDSNEKREVIRIQKDVEVKKEIQKNETCVKLYSSEYVNIKPPLAQKPSKLYETSPQIVRLRESSDSSSFSPTVITVDCSPSPTPSPRTYFQTIEPPSSQRSSSSAYSSNYSTTSSSNITNFQIDSRPQSQIEHARMIRIESREDIQNRF